MVREIITWCSPCYAEDIRSEGTSVVLTINGSKPQSVDVCETHEKEIVEPLRELLAAHGSRIESATVAPTVGRRLCPHCGASLKSADSLAKHIRRSHGEAPDPTQPMVDESELAHGCPDCERRFATPQGMGAHRSRVHGYVGPNNKNASS